MEVFHYDYLNSVKNHLKKEEVIYKELNEIFDIESKPQFIFYLLASVSKYTNDSFFLQKNY